MHAASSKRVDFPARSANHPRMCSTTDVISELIRAANEVGKLSPDERRNLIVRAVRTVREMRTDTGFLSSPGRKDELHYIEIDALMYRSGRDESIKGVLLGLAGMIRTLKIVLDAKDEVMRGDL